MCCVLNVSNFERFSLTIARWLTTSTQRRSESGNYTTRWDATHVTAQRQPMPTYTVVVYPPEQAGLSREKHGCPVNSEEPTRAATLPKRGYKPLANIANRG